MSVWKFLVFVKAKGPTFVFVLKTCNFVQLQEMFGKHVASEFSIDGLMSLRATEAFTASKSAASFAFHMEIDLLLVWLASK